MTKILSRSVVQSTAMELRAGTKLKKQFMKISKVELSLYFLIFTIIVGLAGIEQLIELITEHI